MLWVPVIFDDEGGRSVPLPHLDSKLLLGPEAESLENLLEDFEERSLPGVCIPMHKNASLLLVHSPQKKLSDGHKDAIVWIVLTFMCLSLCFLKPLQCIDHLFSGQTVLVWRESSNVLV